MSPPTAPFPTFPISQITMPSDNLFTSAYAFVKEHCTRATLNHCLRSVAFSLILFRKFPPLATNPDIDKEAVLLSLLMHDMGWATSSSSLTSNEKRFEVDGADIARNFIRTESGGGTGTSDGEKWDRHRLQLMWDAIALHTTPSIAHHKEPEVLATQLSIMAEFFGPHLDAAVPGCSITVDEYQEVLAAWPRLGFKEEMRQTLCGFCRDKPETTLDNFVAEFGRIYGLDGKGGGRDEFVKLCDENNIVRRLEGGLGALEKYEN
ncbi:uncharacterized protein Z519_12595 [Cladophialophora bantiana CBS 173.52]|uniref:HD domain-containing protein n=1 Tax=Cladophialophora bantiana (strain ATCC 10958 / CBS 173.52 / CDC B-1940 / NIH 8579) TaxID=1442370 RepID=A0A0D2HQW9_CLAB1|nr:uncharacterized protein Z519_12595 [Cladophialophora bantiana CBS 173.52]KIW86809.1 hypothetical protein Z519_12595 [Cladophialophora bantiana CBS 173.52]